MATTNVDFYVAGFDAAGKRVISVICDYDPADAKKTDKINTLKEQVRDSAAVGDITLDVVEVITSAEFNQYLSGYVRDKKTGKPVEYVAPPPTATELAKAKIAAVKAKYQPKLDACLNAYNTAALMGNDTSKISAAYKTELAAMNKEIKEG